MRGECIGYINVMEKILIAGAHGTTGKKIVSILKGSSNYEPIAMVRNEEQVAHFKEKGIQTVLGDLEGDVSEVTSNIDRVIFAAGSGGKNVIGVDQNGAKKLIQASKEKGVKKFVMLSSMGADNPEEATQLKDYLKAKHNADEYLKTSGINYSIVRPGALTNDDGKGKIEIGAKLNKSGEISRQDVAETLVSSLNDTIANNKTFEILKGDTSIKEAIEAM